MIHQPPDRKSPRLLRSLREPVYLQNFHRERAVLATTCNTDRNTNISAALLARLARPAKSISDAWRKCLLIASISPCSLSLPKTTGPPALCVQ